ncbi:MAG: hypothetical protein RIA69_02115 [Cyclobacteriaceae bacterium]
MKTRTQFLNKEITFREYYSQFVNEQFIKRVVSTIGHNQLIKAKDSDHLNDIPLRLWDAIGAPADTREKMKLCGDFLSLAGCVCIAKEAARQYLDKIELNKGNND